MVRKQINRSFLLIAICSTVGVVLGGTAAWADSVQCLQAQNPTAQCVTKDPVTRTAEGMAAGLLAGAGAALGATWNLKQKP